MRSCPRPTRSSPRPPERALMDLSTIPDPLSTEQVRRRYDDMAGNWRLLGISDTLLLINRLRRKHFSAARGDVLDVGCGTGENFEYLKKAATLTALDISSEMIEEARRRQRQLGADIRLLIGDAQELPFPQARFDTVISAFSSCTFPDYATAFREMVRVTKPGGRVLLVEHGRSSVALDRPTSGSEHRAGLRTIGLSEQSGRCCRSG